MMYQVKKIDPFNVTDFAGDVFQTSDTETPDAVLVRSSQVDDSLITKRLLLVARSGTGTNTINIDACTENGTAVFNTPGVNANAVKELIIQNLFRCVRPLNEAISMVDQLHVGNEESLQEAAESQRKDYIGQELYGKTLGILGLGTIGQRLADACYHMGMQIIGYNRSFKNLRHVQQLETIEEVMALSDFVVLLLPLTPQTEHLITDEQFKMMKKSAFLLNFGRGELVDNPAVVDALDHDEFAGYVSDFPKAELQHHAKITLLPHLGGNTTEALTHSANLILQNLLDFLENGTVRSSVNFPRVDLPFISPHRLTFFFKTQENVMAKISSLLNKRALPVMEMMNNNQNGFGYTIVNTDFSDFSDEQVTNLVAEFASMKGMLRVRKLDHSNIENWQTD